MTTLSNHPSKSKFQALIVRTVWRFGSPCDAFYGFLNLKPEGVIFAYDHPNEKSWSYDSGELCFHSVSGEITSKLHYHADAGVFLGKCEGKKQPLCLMPVISTKEISGTSTLPALIVNTMPKSGTYFLEAALTRVGWFPTRIHMFSHAQDDYRGLSDGDIHRRPEHSRINCPAECFASSIASGLLAMGHIDDAVAIAVTVAGTMPDTKKWRKS